MGTQSMCFRTMLYFWTWIQVFSGPFQQFGPDHHDHHPHHDQPVPVHYVQEEWGLPQACPPPRRPDRRTSEPEEAEAYHIKSIITSTRPTTMGQWGRATLRTRLWGRDFEDRRLWGHATLRTDDFEDKYYKVFWGQKFCPQSRIKMRLWGQTFKNWQDLQKNPKILKNIGYMMPTLWEYM